jgi:hypothetical protein
LVHYNYMKKGACCEQAPFFIYDATCLEGI